MTRIVAWLVPLLITGLLTGCGMETGPASTESGLTTVRKADYEGTIRYIDEAVSPAPLTAAELGDTSYAIPVEVRFYHDWAVAWHVRDGVTQAGDPAMAVAAWQIAEHVPTSGDVTRDPDDEPSTTAPREPEEGSDITTGTDLGSGTDSLLPSPGYEANHLRELPAFARLDWMREDLDMWRIRPPEYHPGCL